MLARLFTETLPFMISAAILWLSNAVLSNSIVCVKGMKTSTLWDASPIASSIV